MEPVHVYVRLSNAREAVLARHGRLDLQAVHRYETEALIDTGAFRSVLPPLVAEQLGLLSLEQTTAQMANGTEQVTTVMEPVLVEILGRKAMESPSSLGIASCSAYWYWSRPTCSWAVSANGSSPTPPIPINRYFACRRGGR
jgi:hypothetical protein